MTTPLMLLAAVDGPLSPVAAVAVVEDVLIGLLIVVVVLAGSSFTNGAGARTAATHMGVATVMGAAAATAVMVVAGLLAGVTYCTGAALVGIAIRSAAAII